MSEQPNDTVMLGGFPVVQPQIISENRYCILLWGKPGTGKTTLASTAHGKKLWLLFDAQGTDSVSNRDDILVVDLSSDDNCGVCDDLIKFDPLNISKVIASQNITTVVFDSATSFGELALRQGVRKALTTRKGQTEGSSLFDPGMSGYGNKQRYMREALQQLMIITGKMNVNFIVIAHEDKPQKDKKDGSVVEYIMTLGEGLNSRVPANFGEVWYVNQNSRGRQLYVANVGMYKTQKTRIFDVSQGYEVQWDYNPITQTGTTIAGLFDKWRAGNCAKLPLNTK